MSVLWFVFEIGHDKAISVLEPLDEAQVKILDFLNLRHKPLHR